jgi:hypothetical protein
MKILICDQQRMLVRLPGGRQLRRGLGPDARSRAAGIRDGVVAVRSWESRRVRLPCSTTGAAAAIGGDRLGVRVGQPARSGADDHRRGGR